MDLRIFHPRPDDITLANVLHALGDPIRLAIVHRIHRGGAVSCAETFTAPIAKSTLSHHLRILRESGVILSQKAGREYFNTLRLEELEARFPGLLSSILNIAPDDGSSG